MWDKPRLHVRPGGLLVWVLVWFFDGGGILAALLPGVLVHELGHFLLLKMGGMRLRSISLGLFGLEMDYYGLLGGVHGFLSILAGPAFGLAYALVAACIPGEYWSLSAGLSLALSVFNLLPVLPLDGGRLLLQIFPKKGRGLSCVFAMCFAAAALCAWLACAGLFLPAGAAWLLCCNFGRKPVS